jgi:hypothetical protein
MPNSPIFVKVGSISNSVKQYFTPTAGQTIFVWTQSSALAANCQVQRDGQELRPNDSDTWDYTVSGTSVIFNVAPWGGDGTPGWVMIRQ